MSAEIATLIVASVSLGLTALVIAAAVIRWILDKRRDANLAFRELPTKLKSLDEGLSLRFNESTGRPPEEKVTLDRVLAVDLAILNTSTHRQVREIKWLHARYKWWGRGRKFWKTPTRLEGQNGS